MLAELASDVVLIAGGPPMVLIALITSRNVKRTHLRTLGDALVRVRPGLEYRLEGRGQRPYLAILDSALVISYGHVPGSRYPFTTLLVIIPAWPGPGPTPKLEIAPKGLHRKGWVIEIGRVDKDGGDRLAMHLKTVLETAFERGIKIHTLKNADGPMTVHMVPDTFAAPDLLRVIDELRGLPKMLREQCGMCTYQRRVHGEM